MILLTCCSDIIQYLKWNSDEKLTYIHTEYFYSFSLYRKLAEIVSSRIFTK